MPYRQKRRRQQGEVLHVSLQSIRDYLGHTYEEMTRQYVDYMPQRIAQANDKFFDQQESSLVSWLRKEEQDAK